MVLGFRTVASGGRVLTGRGPRGALAAGKIPYLDLGSGYMTVDICKSHQAIQLKLVHSVIFRTTTTKDKKFIHMP